MRNEYDEGNAERGWRHSLTSVRGLLTMSHLPFGPRSRLAGLFLSRSLLSLLLLLLRSCSCFSCAVHSSFGESLLMLMPLVVVRLTLPVSPSATCRPTPVLYLFVAFAVTRSSLSPSVRRPGLIYSTSETVDLVLGSQPAIPKLRARRPIPILTELHRIHGRLLSHERTNHPQTRSLPWCLEITRSR